MKIKLVLTFALALFFTACSGGGGGGDVPPTTSDTTPPTVSVYSPRDVDTDIDITAELVLTFSEDIQKGSGNITIKKTDDNSTVETIDIANTTVSSNTLTINPSSNFNYSTGYYVQIDATAIDDTSGNSYAGISSSAAWNFTTESDTVAPTVSAYSPADNGTSVDVTTNLVLTFSEAIQKGTGNITIKRASDDTTFETIDVTSSAVTVSSTTLTINPYSDFNYSTSYYVQIDVTAIDDMAGNSYAGISDTTTWNFTTDEHGDGFDTASFVDINTTDTSTSYIDARFDDVNDIDCFKFYVVSSGSLQLAGFTILDGTVDGLTYAFYDQNKSYLTPSSQTINVTPGTYYLKVQEDNGGIGGYRLTFNYTKSFDDTTAPTAYRLIPSDNDKFTYPSQEFKLLFSENIAAGAGTVKIYDSGDTLIETINASDTTIDENMVTMNPSNLSNGTSYYLKIDSNAFNDLSGNSYVGISNTTSWNFTTIPSGYDDNEDYIPDSIEAVNGMSSSSSDEDGDGVVDGLNLTGSYGDEFFDKQWHILSLGTEVNDNGFATIYGNDLNVLGLYHRYMGYNGGNNIIVQVVDNGVDADHEDLADNMDIARSYYGIIPTQGDPSPIVATDTHGTEVAGIIGARAFNGKGVRGIAPFVKIAGSNYITYQSVTNLEKVWYSGDGANEIAITNNSWGSYYNTSTVYELILQYGTTYLRDGKGRIYVFSAGNDRGDNGSANLHYMKNNRYGVAVAAVRHDNTYAVYSTPGSNVLVSGYAGDYSSTSPTIGTTTVMGQGTPGAGGDTWAEDTAGNYTYAMNGTSAAAPVVSGSLALVLEACPDLTWRDVKYLAAKNSVKIDSDNATWVQNSAGFWHSVDYGYGLINPKGMIAECTNGYTNLPTEINFEVNTTYTSSNSIPDNDSNGISFTIDTSSETTINNVEWVEVTINSNHTYASDLKVELTSPSGTTTELIHAGTNATTIGISNFMEGGHRLSSAAFYDESANGNWTVKVSDLSAVDTGDINSIGLKVYGH